MYTPLLAERDPSDLLQRADFLWSVGILIVTLFFGAILLSWLERWRKKQLSNSATEDVERFGSFRQMFENGELSKEEYDRIKLKEALRLRDKVKISPTTSNNQEKPAVPTKPAVSEPESPPSSTE